MTILFYYPSNKRSNSIETLLSELKHKGYNMVFLTTCEKGDLHNALDKLGVKTYTAGIGKKGSVRYYFKQMLFLIRFCKKERIDWVFSNLQQANIISVFAQWFSKTRFIIFRHHFKFNMFSDEKHLTENKTEAMFDKIINKLAKVIIVPSSGVFNGMKSQEGVSEHKMNIIPYVYDFEQYAKPDATISAQLKQTYHCKLLLLMCSRLIEFKRHHIVFPIIKKLVTEKGLDIKMLVLDEGPEKEKLQAYISHHGLQNYIFLLGFKRDFVNYMAAADLLIHPSLTEASNSVVKEMGYLKKAVAVCHKVGDFDDYIVDRENGYLMSPINTQVEIEEIILDAYYCKDVLNRLGERLHADVLTKFNKSDEVLKQYEALIGR